MGFYKRTRLILEINGPGGAVLREMQITRQIVTTGYLRDEAVEHNLKNFFNNVKQYVYSRVDALLPGQGSLHWKTSSSNKVAVMERMRDFASNGTLIVRSLDLCNEMRQITRDGDAICAEGTEHDDRVMACAFGILCWEQMERKGLVAMSRTRDSELAKYKLSAQDQLALMNKYQLNQFFDGKRRARLSAAAATRRQGWRGR
jgi:hypothetical protein